jgi:AcrR family transcriptional regulator
VTAAVRHATTEQQIMKSALKLFARQGFAATGIRQLADEVGVTSSTLYHYMGTKDDLLFAIVGQSLTRLIDAAQRVTSEGLAPITTLCALVHVHVVAHATRSAETAVVDHELRSLAGRRRDEAIAMRDHYESFWRDTIAAGCAAGEFAVHDQRMARLGLLQMCSGVAGWYSPSGELSLAELAVTHAQMALGLLGNSMGFDAVSTLLAATDAAAVVADIWASPDRDVSTSR